jgi:hypothetical protein
MDAGVMVDFHTQKKIITRDFVSGDSFFLRVIIYMYMCSFIDSLENLNIHTYTYTHKQGYGAILSLLFCLFKICLYSLHNKSYDQPSHKSLGTHMGQIKFQFKQIKTA